MVRRGSFLIYMDALVLGRAVAYDLETGGLPTPEYRLLQAARAYCASRVLLTRLLRAEVDRQFGPNEKGLVLSGLRSFQSETEKVLVGSSLRDPNTAGYVPVHRELIQDAIAHEARVVVTNLRPWLGCATQVRSDYDVQILRPSAAIRMINNMRGSL